MLRRLKKLLVAGLIAFIPSQAFAQTSGSTSIRSAQSPGAAPAATSLAKPTGHDVDFGVGGYKYVEPGDTSISIHGPKFGGGYTGTTSLNPGQHWFLQTDARGSRWQHHVRWLAFALPDHARQHVAQWLRAGPWQSVAVQRERRQGLVRGRPCSPLHGTAISTSTWFDDWASPAGGGLQKSQTQIDPESYNGCQRPIGDPAGSVGR
jgi:hypothetical protein